VPGECGGHQRRHGIADVALLIAIVAVEDKAIVERLESGRLSDSDRAVVAVMREPT